MLVYAAIAALLALMGGFVYYASLDNPKLESAEIKLQSVEVLNVNTVDNKAQLEVKFLIKNPSDKTFTIPNIGYKLFADGSVVGSGQYSTEDIAMPGRAVFNPGAEIPLSSKLSIIKSEQNAAAYDAIVNERVGKFSAEGILTVESAWSIIEKEFETST